ncbi:MAG: adenosine kinase [Candidatus Limimorpha sp.]
MANDRQTVIGIGNALVDILTRIDNDDILKALNLPKGSMQLVDDEFSARIAAALSEESSTFAPGGSAANTIHGLAKCGIKTGFICYTGNDDTGRFFEQSMREAGVEPVVFRGDAVSGTAHAIVSTDGERTFATNLGAAVLLSESHLRKEMFDGWGYCYIEGYLIANRPLFSKTIKLAKNAGCKTVLDLASYNVVEDNRDFLKDILSDIDIVFANEEEAKALTGDTPENALDYLASRCEIAIVKIGKKGSLIKKGEEKISIAGSEVAVVDTTGAGDMYAAGFIAGLINDLPLKQCGEWGNCLATNIIQVLGAKMDEDKWDKIRQQYPIK